MAQCVIFLFAGIETSAITLAFTAYELANHPEIQEKLHHELNSHLDNNEGKINYNTLQEMPYLDMVISETLRLHPPITRVDRQCQQDNYKLGNATLSKSMMIIIPIYCIHHDEEFYPNPEEFEPERFSAENRTKRNPYTYLPFGTGPRSCLGNRFALLQIKLTLVHLLSKYRFTTCPQTEVPVKINPNSSELLQPLSITLGLESRIAT